MRRNLFVIKPRMFLRYYSDSADSNSKLETEGSISNNPLDNDDVDKLKKVILEENKEKSGIYMFTNKETKEVYIGQSKILIPSFQVSKFPSFQVSKFPSFKL